MFIRSEMSWSNTSCKISINKRDDEEDDGEEEEKEYVCISIIHATRYIDCSTTTVSYGCSIFMIIKI